MEPEWAKKIDSKTVVNYYYNIFFLFAIVYGAIVLVTAYTTFTNPRIGYSGLINAFFIYVISCINMLFMYIISSRALLK